MAEADERKNEEELEIITSKPEVSPRYKWCNYVDKEEKELVTLQPGISELSIFQCGEQILKSAAYTALGAALFEGKNIIIWIDFPIELVKKYCNKQVTSRVYWGEVIKKRSYTYWEEDGDLFGLAPATQRLRIRDDTYLKQYGLKLKTSKFCFTTDYWNHKVRYLELDIGQIITEPTKTKIQKWLKMNNIESQEDRCERLENEMKKRMNEEKREIELK